MRTKLLSLDEMKAFVGRDDFDFSEDNSALMRRAGAVLREAIEEELTERQRECVKLYFFDGLREHEIGEMLGVNKSTVSRHIKKAKARLRLCVKYSCFESERFH